LAVNAFLHFQSIERNARRSLHEEIAIVLKPTITCKVCRRSVSRKRRRQQFCSARCRLADFRNRKALHRHTGSQPLAQNYRTKAGAEKRFIHSPINLIGGHRWPGTKVLEPTLTQAIVNAEVGNKIVAAASPKNSASGNEGVAPWLLH
jgi:hypothetical protein